MQVSSAKKVRIKPSASSASTDAGSEDEAAATNPKLHTKLATHPSRLPQKSARNALEGIRDTAVRRQTMTGAKNNVVVVRRPKSLFSRLRVRVGIVMANFWMEVAMMVVTMLYAALVLFDLMVPDDVSDAAADAVWSLDITFLSILVLELSLKLFAFGREYCRDSWNMFDGFVVLLSLLLGLLAEALTSIVLLRVLRIRAVLRVFRLVVVLRRAKVTAVTVKRIRHRVAREPGGKPPLVEALDILSELRHQLAHTNLHHDIHRVEDLLASESLYRPTHIPTMMNRHGEVDMEVDAWLRSMWANQPAGGGADGADITEAEGREIQEAGASPRDADGNATGAGAGEGASGRRSQSVEPKDAEAQCAELVHRMSSSGRRVSVVLNNMAKAGPGPLDAGRPVTASSEASPPSLVTDARLASTMAQLSRWDFDVFSAHELSGGHPLYAVVVSVTEAFDLLVPFKIDQFSFQQLLLRIEAAYIPTNTYHNAVHAADVTQGLAYLMAKSFLLPHLSTLEQLGAVMAAAIHDLAHPGVNNAFCVATSAVVAITYNDNAVLENMHIAKFYQMMKQHKLDVFKVLSRKDYRNLRRLIIDMVLSTDMAKHFEEVAVLTSKLAALTRSDSPELEDANAVTSPRRLGAHIQTPEDSSFYLRLALHTADVSNPARAPILMRQWVERVCEEFYSQGDRERALGLPISSFMDRTAPHVPKLQLGFINFIVMPLFQQWGSVIQEVQDVCVANLQRNKQFWEHESAKMEAEDAAEEAATTARSAHADSPRAASGRGSAAVAPAPVTSPTVSNVAPEPSG